MSRSNQTWEESAIDEEIRGHYAKASALFRRALIGDPDSKELRYRLGMVCFKMGEMTEAIDQLSEALRIAPQDSRICVDLGSALLCVGQGQDAQMMFKRAVRIDASCTEGYFLLGKLAQRNGEYADARRCFHQTLERNPQYMEAHLAIAETLLETGDARRAAIHFKHALDICPDMDAARQGLVWAQLAED